MKQEKYFCDLCRAHIENWSSIFENNHKLTDTQKDVTMYNLIIMHGVGEHFCRDCLQDISKNFELYLKSRCCNK